MRLYFILALLVVTLDQITKVWALTSCVVRRELFPGISCELVFNKGISWGMFQAHGMLEQVTLTLLLIGIILFLMHYTCRRIARGFGILGEVLVIAGALSNIADRFLHGAVVDFIHLGYWGIEFPTFFNIADTAIVLGVLLMLFSTKGSYATTPL